MPEGITFRYPSSSNFFLWFCQMLFGVQRCNLATFAYQSVTALKQHVPHVRSDLRSDNVLASHVGHVGTYPCTHLRLTAPENSSPLHGAHRASQLPTDGGLCCLQPKKHGGSTTWCCFLGTSGGEVGVVGGAHRGFLEGREA